MFLVVYWNNRHELVYNFLICTVHGTKECNILNEKKARLPLAAGQLLFTGVAVGKAFKL